VDILFSIINGIIYVGVDSMLYLKKIHFADVEEEYKAIKTMPVQENGFENKYHDVTKEEFINEVIPKLLKNSEGLDLPDGYVPDTYFFLWDDNKIVGLFKIRHYLNDFLRKGAGHIGYGILPEYRGKGYAKQGLLLAIEKCKEIIKEDEIYLSVHKIPFKEKAFDIVIANHVLFYFDDIDVVLKECKRVLKDTGSFVCSTYSQRHMKEITETMVITETTVATTEERKTTITDR